MYGAFFLRLLTNRNVRFAPESGQIGRRLAMSALCQNRSFDYFVGQRKQLWRNFKSHRLCRLEIYDQFKFRRLLHRQIGRLGPLQNLIDKDRRFLKHVWVIRPVRHEPASDDK